MDMTPVLNELPSYSSIGLDINSTNPALCDGNLSAKINHNNCVLIELEKFEKNDKANENNQIGNILHFYRWKRTQLDTQKELAEKYANDSSFIRPSDYNAFNTLYLSQKWVYVSGDENIDRGNNFGHKGDQKSTSQSPPKLRLQTLSSQIPSSDLAEVYNMVNLDVESWGYKEYLAWNSFEINCCCGSTHKIVIIDENLTKSYINHQRDDQLMGLNDGDKRG